VELDRAPQAQRIRSQDIVDQLEVAVLRRIVWLKPKSISRAMRRLRVLEAQASPSDPHLLPKIAMSSTSTTAQEHHDQEQLQRLDPLHAESSGFRSFQVTAKTVRRWVERAQTAADLRARSCRSS
jgi:hypothetical protein